MGGSGSGVGIEMGLFSICGFIGFLSLLISRRGRFLACALIRRGRNNVR